jgi:hypothetical protein
VTPTHTGRAPTHPSPPDDPRTQTALYHLDGTPFGGRHASPAGAAELQPGESVRRGPADLEISRAEHAMPLTTAAIRRMQDRIADLTAQVEAWMDAASRSSGQAFEAVRRAAVAAAQAEDAETRLVIAQRVALRLLRRPKARALEAAIDHAAREITGRPHRELAADLDRQLAAYPEDDETLVVEPPLTPEQIASAVAARRQIGLEHDPLVALADLVTRWLTVERQIDLEERTPSREVAYGALEALDEAQVALRRAVTP